MYMQIQNKKKNLRPFHPPPLISKNPRDRRLSSRKKHVFVIIEFNSRSIRTRAREKVVYNSWTKKQYDKNVIPSPCTIIIIIIISILCKSNDCYALATYLIIQSLRAFRKHITSVFVLFSSFKSNIYIYTRIVSLRQK